MKRINKEEYLCAANSIKPFVLPTSKPHYPPDRVIDLKHIVIGIEPDFEKETIKGIATLRFESKREGVKTIRLNSALLQISSVMLNQEEKLNFESLGEDLFVYLAEPTKRGEKIELSIQYSGKPAKGLYFRKPDRDHPERPLQLWTQGEDEDSHYWFPCIDAPAIKVTSEVIAKVPKNMTAVSNGRLIQVKEEEDSKVYHWLQDKPHSVYLVSLVVGEYVELKDEFDGVPLLYYVYKGREEDAKRSFSETPNMMKFFSDKIGYRYPWDKYAQTVVSDFIFGGMENTSATTLTDTTLHDERAHIDFSSHPLVAHELAHMWFGDLLTCRHWSHGWLNESFATYFQLLYTQFSRGEDEFLMERLEDFENYLEEFRSHYARPIVTNVYESPSELFDRHLYEKGGMVLHMIKTKLGDEDFWRAVNNYVKKNAFSVVETSDLARAIEESTGVVMDEFMEQWVYRPGHPELVITYRPDSSPQQLLVKQQQEGEPFRFDLEVKVKTEQGEQFFVFPISQKEQTIFLPLQSIPSYISIDPNFNLLATVDFTRPREMMIRQLFEDTTYGRIQAARSLAKDSSLESINGLKKCMLEDRFWGVRGEAAKALAEIGNSTALEALLLALQDKNAKARRMIVQAIGKFKNELASKALIDLLKRGDESYFVEAEAARSLGKTRQKEGYDILLQAMSRPSFNDVIQVGAIEGLAELRDERALPIIMERTEKRYSNNVRRAATLALGKFDRERQKVKDMLVSLLKDDWFRVRTAAAEALVERREFEAINDIEQAIAREVDGRVRRSFREAISRLRAQQPTSEEIKMIKEELEKLKEENRKIRERLERLEKK